MSPTSKWWINSGVPHRDLCSEDHCFSFSSFLSLSLFDSSLFSSSLFLNTLLKSLRWSLPCLSYAITITNCSSFGKQRKLNWVCFLPLCSVAMRETDRKDSKLVTSPQLYSSLYCYYSTLADSGI